MEDEEKSGIGSRTGWKSFKKLKAHENGADNNKESGQGTETGLGSEGGVQGGIGGSREGALLPASYRKPHC